VTRPAKLDSDPIIIDYETAFLSEPEGARVIDFVTHRLGTVRRALSHDVIRAEDDEDLDDEFEFALLTAGIRFR